MAALADAFERDLDDAILNLTPRHCKLIVEALRHSSGATNAVSVPPSMSARETVARILAHKMPSLRVDDRPGKYAHAIADEVLTTLALSSPQ